MIGLSEGKKVSGYHFHFLTMLTPLGHPEEPNHNNLYLNPQPTESPIGKPHLKNPYYGTTHIPIEKPQPQLHRPAPP